MKKLIFGLLMLFAVATKVSAQENDPGMTKYWYYPDRNVYFNEANTTYWYYSVTSSAWVAAKALPTTYAVTNTDPRFTVYYKGPDVWKDNKAHLLKYKAKAEGGIKQKPKNSVGS